MVTPDVGGGFGTKLFIYREYALAALAARQLKRTGRLDRRSHRALSRRRAGPRQHHHRQARARRQGPLPRARHRPDRRHGRVSVGLCALHSVPWRRHVAWRLRYSALPRQAARAPIPTRCRSMPIAAPGRPEAAYVIERAGRCRRARTERGARRAAAAQFHQAEGDAVHDRHRQESTTPAISPATWRARRRSPTGTASRSAPPRRQEARPAARHRPCDLHRSLRQHGAGHRDDQAGAGRRRHRADGLAIDRAGPRHVLRADRRRSSRPAAGARADGAGRHRSHRDRHRHRRIELDPVRRRFARRRQQDAGGESQAACRGRAGGERRRSRDRRRRGACRRHRPRHHVRRSRQARRTPRPTSSPRRTPSRRRSRPIPTARTSPRSRSTRRPARRASSTTSWSTISASRSIRCCWPARCTAARCRASARR